MNPTPAHLDPLTRRLYAALAGLLDVSDLLVSDDDDEAAEAVAEAQDALRCADDDPADLDGLRVVAALPAFEPIDFAALRDQDRARIEREDAYARRHNLPRAS